MTEHYNQSLMQSLSHYTSSNKKDWDVNLQVLLFGFRIAPSPTTGESPFYLLYGRDPILPVEVPLKPPTQISSTILSYRETLVRQMQLTHRVASEQIQFSQQTMKNLYDCKSKPYPYKVGNLVWLFTPKTQKGLSKKLLHNWHGLYRLVEQLLPVNFKLHTCHNRLLPTPVHVNRLKPCTDPIACLIDPPVDQDDPIFNNSEVSFLPSDSFAPADLVAQPPAAADDNDPLYEIETILKRRTKKRVPECLIKWKGFANKHNSWIPASSIVDTGNIQPGPSTSQVSNISISSSPVQLTTMALPKPKLNPWPYFLFSICFLASMSYLSATPYLGPLYIVPNYMTPLFSTSRHYQLQS